MKYIRTKNGKIINISKYKIAKRMYDGVYYKNSDRELWRVINVEDIKAEADTIEELCDEAIVIEQWRDKPFVLSVGGNGTPLSCARALYLLQGCIIYGSIWVDGNLIKVAQMNEKGELKLL